MRSDGNSGDYCERDVRTLASPNEQSVEMKLLDRGNMDGMRSYRYARVFFLCFIALNSIVPAIAQIEAQQAQINALKELVCAQNPAAKVCRQQGEK